MTSGQKKSARPKKPCSAGGKRGGGGIPGECTSIKVWKTVTFFVKTVDSVLKKTRTVLYKM